MLWYCAIGNLNKLTLIVRVECHGPPAPLAVHAVGLEEVVEGGHKPTGSLAQVDRVQLGGCLGHQRPKLDQDLVELDPALRAHLGAEVATHGGHHDARAVGEEGVPVPADHLLVVELLLCGIEMFFEFQQPFHCKRLVLEHPLRWREGPFFVLVLETELLAKEFLHLLPHFVAVALFEPEPRPRSKSPSAPATPEIIALTDPASPPVATPTPSPADVVSVVLRHWT